MMVNIKNKKGDIPISILIIGIVLVCCIAIISFFSSMNKVRNSFAGIATMEQLNSQLEQNTFNGVSLEGVHFEKKATKGILLWKREIVLFSAEYKFKP